MAICANALLEGNPTDPDGLVLINRLEAQKTVDGDAVYWISGGQSFTLKGKAVTNGRLDTFAGLGYDNMVILGCRSVSRELTAPAD